MLQQTNTRLFWRWKWESDNFPHFSILCCLVSFLLFMFHEFYSFSSFSLECFLLPSCSAEREWKDEANESKYQHVRLCNLMPFRLNPNAAAVAWIFLSFVFYFWTKWLLTNMIGITHGLRQWLQTQSSRSRARTEFEEKSFLFHLWWLFP